MDHKDSVCVGLAESDCSAWFVFARSMGFNIIFKAYLRQFFLCRFYQWIDWVEKSFCFGQLFWFILFFQLLDGIVYISNLIRQIRSWFHQWTTNITMEDTGIFFGWLWKWTHRRNKIRSHRFEESCNSNFCKALFLNFFTAWCNQLFEFCSVFLLKKSIESNKTTILQDTVLANSRE